MYVEGYTEPVVMGAKVSVQRKNRLGLSDRSPSVVFTDGAGRFKYGPTQVDDYDIDIEKDGYEFSRLSHSNFNFQSRRSQGLL